MKKLGKYPLIRKLGVGGMGEVWLSEHPNLGIPVAIKLMHPAGNERKDLQQRFKNEAKIIARIKHPNIVHIYDADIEGDTHFYVMEYVEGLNLAEYLKSTPSARLGHDEILRIVREVTLALQEAHKHGVVHRDIKPENILLTKSGEVKLADLGIARLSEENSDGLTGSNTGMGTPHYMAPEQIICANTADIRADLYSLGITFYLLATGSVPFDDDSDFEVMRKHIDCKVPHPTEACKGMREDVAAVICKLLEKSPEFRYQTPLELIQDLDVISGNTESVSTGLKATIIPQVLITPKTACNPSKSPSISKYALAGILLTALVLAVLYIPNNSHSPEGQHTANKEEVPEQEKALNPQVKLPVKPLSTNKDEWTVYMTTLEKSALYPELRTKIDKIRSLRQRRSIKDISSLPVEIRQAQHKVELLTGIIKGLYINSANPDKSGEIVLHYTKELLTLEENLAAQIKDYLSKS